MRSVWAIILVFVVTFSVFAIDTEPQDNNELQLLYYEKQNAVKILLSQLRMQVEDTSPALHVDALLFVKEQLEVIQKRINLMDDGKGYDDIQKEVLGLIQELRYAITLKPAFTDYNTMTWLETEIELLLKYLTEKDLENSQEFDLQTITGIRIEGREYQNSSNAPSTSSLNAYEEKVAGFETFLQTQLKDRFFSFETGRIKVDNDSTATNYFSDTGSLQFKLYKYEKMEAETVTVNGTMYNNYYTDNRYKAYTAFEEACKTSIDSAREFLKDRMVFYTIGESSNIEKNNNGWQYTSDITMYYIIRKHETIHQRSKYIVGQSYNTYYNDNDKNALKSFEQKRDAFIAEMKKDPKVLYAKVNAPESIGVQGKNYQYMGEATIYWITD